MEDNLEICPYCESSDYIFEREIPIKVLDDLNGGVLIPYVKEYKYFCGQCNKDF
jgi:hypothetical protein